MAAVTLLGTATFDTNSGTKTVTATPAVNDLIVIVTAHTGNTSAATPTDDQSGTYVEITSAVKAFSADTMRVFIRSALISSAVSTVFTHAPGTSDGGGLAVLKVTGMSRVGASAAKQSAKQDNQTATGTPAPVFASACLTGNAVIGAVFNASNPAGLTPPTSYTERVDTGYSTPGAGLECVSRDSGETGTTITWGSTSATAFGSLVVELDTSSSSFSQAPGIGTETDTALALTAVNIRATGVSTETDTSLSHSLVLGLGLSTSTNTALALGHVQIQAVGLATETDTALALVNSLGGPLGMATEADTAFGLGVRLNTGLVSETDMSLGLVQILINPVGLSTETETAFAENLALSFTTATETDTGLTLGYVQAGTVKMAQERNYSWPSGPNASIDFIDGYSSMFGKNLRNYPPKAFQLSHKRLKTFTSPSFSKGRPR